MSAEADGPLTYLQSLHESLLDRVSSSNVEEAIAAGPFSRGEDNLICEVLFPHVAEFTREYFDLDSVSLRIDGREVANYLYTEREVDALMRLLRRYLRTELAKMMRYEIRLRAIGNLRRLPRDPFTRDAELPAERTWGLRSYDSPHDAPR